MRKFDLNLIIIWTTFQAHEKHFALHCCHKNTFFTRDHFKWFSRFFCTAYKITGVNGLAYLSVYSSDPTVPMKNQSQKLFGSFEEVKWEYDFNFLRIHHPFFASLWIPSFFLRIAYLTFLFISYFPYKLEKIQNLLCVFVTWMFFFRHE